MNFIKKLFGKKPEPIVPVVPEIVEEPEPDLTKWERVEPTGTIFDKSKVVDIITAFNYLMSRTSSKTTDYRTEAVNELDSFLTSGEVIDLRKRTGFVCTDGVYLIQYGIPSDGVPFTCIRLVNYEGISPNFVDIHKAELDRLFDKHMVKYLKGKTKEEFNKIFVEAYRFVPKVVNVGIGGECIIPASFRDDINFKDDPAYVVRVNTGFSFGSSLVHHIVQMTSEAKNIFHYKDRLFAIIGGIPFIYSPDNTGTGIDFLLSEETVNSFRDEYFQRRSIRTLIHGRAPFEIDKLKGSMDRILAYDGPVYEDEDLPIKFIGL